MTDDIEARLAAAAQAVRALEVGQQRHADLIGREDRVSAEVRSLRGQYALEEEDVSRLEHLSFARVVASLKGSRASDLERERAEADAARLHVADAQSRLDALQAELRSVSDELRQLASAPEDYAAALAAKERLLTESGDPRRARLLDLAEEKGRLTAEVAEIDRALRDAGAAELALSQVGQILASAKSWNTYDTFFGGGLMADIAEHNRLDQAARAAAEADRRMSVLRTELAEIETAASPSGPLAISSTTKFVDMWFGNIFTDLAIRSRIQQAQANVSSGIQLVDRVRAQLTGRAARARDRLSAIEAERRSLLTG
ncbi:MAG: hypothetical protein M0030_29170 [Actinomycetota bacterium]|nr:hypothetical protein [Actinomycetota bacterium]